MTKYVKKPVEAFQWFKIGDHPEVKKSNNGFFICSPEGYQKVIQGDWIIKDPEGYSRVKDDIFRATYYEEVKLND